MIGHARSGHSRRALDGEFDSPSSPPNPRGGRIGCHSREIVAAVATISIEWLSATISIEAPGWFPFAHSGEFGDSGVERRFAGDPARRQQSPDQLAGSEAALERAICKPRRHARGVGSRVLVGSHNSAVSNAGRNGRAVRLFK
jgi:hypothetical protein